MNTGEVPVWLCDLTHTEQTIAADVMPAAIGCIAEYARSRLSRPPSFELYKYPEELAAALETFGAPRIVGFSNYVWNKDLSVQFAAAIKKRHPETIIVFGGPNYPIPDDERRRWLQAHPMIDFYIVGDGETGFTLLLESLLQSDFRTDDVPANLPGVHHLLADGTAVTPGFSEKINDLTTIPSPYLSGMLDKFFDGKLVPIIQTVRGCPFSCSFCTEGQFYHSRVGKTALDKLTAEFRYIAEKMALLRDTAKGRTDMHIADSNFGMYKEDVAIAGIIAQTKAEYGYPEYIQCSMGKNQKHRILKVAGILEGGIKISGAVQSLDETVMKNIGRKNIKGGEIVELAKEARNIGSDSDSAVIMALPGDTLAAHFNTVRTVIEAGYNVVYVYQLMLLAGSDLGTLESRRKWGMKTGYRLLPRCFGQYSVFGENLTSVEIEEICIANDSFSFDDYLKARKFNFVVNVFFNEGVFLGILKLLDHFQISKFDWLYRIYERIRTGACGELFEAYARDAEEEIWHDQERLRAFAARDGNFRRLSAGEIGANLVFNYKASALVHHLDDMAELARQSLVELLREKGEEEAVAFAEEIVAFDRLSVKGILTDPDAVYGATFSYDIESFIWGVTAPAIGALRLGRPTTFRFALSPSQKRTVANMTGVYGRSINGYGRIIARFSLQQLFRRSESEGLRTAVDSSLLRRISRSRGRYGLHAERL